jgi:hypothetical protein
MTKQQDLAVKLSIGKYFHRFGSLNSSRADSEDNEVRRMLVEHHTQLGSLRALAGNKSQFFQGLP